MQSQLRGFVLAGATVALATTGLSSGAEAGVAQPHNIIEAARATVEDLDGSHYRTEFRANLRRADAVVVLPQFTGPSEQGRPAVVVVHDGARGAWSNPAFYRARPSKGAGDVPEGRAILMVMNVGAVRPIMEGSASLGPKGLEVESITTNVNPEVQINATADILAFADVQRGAIGASSFNGWTLTADPQLNQRYYTAESTPEDILTRGTTKTPGVERLLGGLRVAQGIDESLP